MGLELGTPTGAHGAQDGQALDPAVLMLVHIEIKEEEQRAEPPVGGRRHQNNWKALFSARRL